MEEKPYSTLIEGFKQPDDFMPSKVKLTANESTTLNELIERENAAKKAAEKANRDRDGFCMELERKYGMQGMKWTFDAGQGTIQIAGGIQMSQGSSGLNLKVDK